MTEEALGARSFCSSLSMLASICNLPLGEPLGRSHGTGCIRIMVRRQFYETAFYFSSVWIKSSPASSLVYSVESGSSYPQMLQEARTEVA